MELTFQTEWWRENAKGKTWNSSNIIIKVETLMCWGDDGEFREACEKATSPPFRYVCNPFSRLPYQSGFSRDSKQIRSICLAGICLSGLPLWSLDSSSWVRHPGLLWSLIETHVLGVFCIINNAATLEYQQYLISLSTWFYFWYSLSLTIK